MKHIIAKALVIFLVAPCALIAQKNKAGKKSVAIKDTVAAKPATPYEKLFKGKSTQTEKGLITLHKTEGKIYFEFPVKLLNKMMLVGSVVEAVSNSDDAFAGQQVRAPITIYFSMIDSIVYIHRSFFASPQDEKDPGIERALSKNNLAPVMASYKVLAVPPDSTAIVFEPTDFFVNGTAVMDPFSPVSGLNGRTTSFKSERSLPGDIKAYPDNITISSYLSFAVSSSYFGFVTEIDRPATAIIKRSLVLLPERTMRPRINDPRIGVAFTRQQKYSGSDNGIKTAYLANRWKLEPSDTAAWLRGELVAPVKPVIFYIDDLFPAKWAPYVKSGVEGWNKAFEKAGFKNAIVVRDYPKNDPAFDSDNIRYNCIKYAPTSAQEAAGPAWVDPRSGEILNGSIYIHDGIINKLSQELFLKTAAADKRARTVNMPEDLIGSALLNVAARETGRCLGLLSNLSASAAIPADSLRSPSFTQQYGITASIMDDVNFNFVAQPGDVEKGVRMTPLNLGVYDYYAIQWLYSPVFSAVTAKDEVPVLDKWISEKIKDPMYRFGKKQANGAIDPNAQSDDLGDDQVKATQYAYNNLRYLLKNMSTWVDNEDKDYSFRRTNNFAIINIEFYWYLTHVLANIGGIYKYEKYEGDPLPSYQVVPKKTQKSSLLFLLKSLENLSWMNDANVAQNIDNVNGDASNYLRKILFPYVMRWVAKVGFSESKGTRESYTQAECIADVFDYVWGDALSGKKPVAEKLSMQTALVYFLINNSAVLSVAEAESKASTAASTEDLALNRMAAIAARQHGLREPDDAEAGFGPAAGIVYQNNDISHIYYEWLLQSRDVLQKIVNKHPGSVQENYQYLLSQINKALKKGD